MNKRFIFIFSSILFQFLLYLQSGKLVLKLFSSIKEVAEDPNALVLILIDEIESITYARDCVSSNEPSDSLRVVNAVLTQLDQLRRHPNVLILTTSNLTSSIDSAFVDRADLKQYVGCPSPIAIFHIFKSAVEELIKVKVVIHFLITIDSIIIVIISGWHCVCRIGSRW